MKLKKVNAAIGLLSILAMIVHVAYHVFCYATFYYNPMLKVAVSLPLIVRCACMRFSGCSRCSSAQMARGSTFYRKQNSRIVVKRVSAALIFPLLIVHVNSFGLMQQYAQAGNKALVVLLIAAEVLLFAVVFAHIATCSPKPWLRSWASCATRARFRRVFPTWSTTYRLRRRSATTPA